MIKFLTIIGARPQFIKAASLSRAINKKFNNSIEEVLLHTGQHYDNNMSDVFFSELNISQPKYNLNIGSNSHGIQTAHMITGIEESIQKENPDVVILFGDTNSTLAGAVASSKLKVPIAHIEAGLRSFNKSMPEEINRVICDHCSTFLFAPTIKAIENLKSEGFDENNKRPYSIDKPGIFHCGDVMYDNTLYFSHLAEEKSTIFNQINSDKNDYSLVTIHRDFNTDNTERLNSIFKGLHELTIEFAENLIIPIHPRTKKALHNHLNPNIKNSVFNNKRINIIDPVSFFDMIILEKYANMIITDSGGVQKESFFLKKPCLILRPETEWIELVECGCAKIVDNSIEKLLEGYKYYISIENMEFPSFYGKGNASEDICKILTENYLNT